MTACLAFENAQKKELCSAFHVWRQLASRNAILLRRLEALQAQKQTSILRTAFENMKENVLLAREAQAAADKARLKPAIDLIT